MKRVICILLALTMLLASSVSAFACFKPRYKNFVILGDSLCLGFSTEAASMYAYDTFDIVSNVYRAANGHNSSGDEDSDHNYTHCYPTVLAKKLGIDTFQNNKNKNIFTEGDKYDDVYNFGICANWSKDNYELLSNPHWNYIYQPKYVEKFTIPTTGTCFDTTTKQITDLPTSYQNYGYWNNEWVVPVPGSEVPVQSYWGLNQIIIDKFYWIDKKAYEENGEFIYYPGYYDYSGQILPGYAVYTDNPWWPTYVTIDEPELMVNPQIIDSFYHDYVTDKIKNGSLIALACGGNDIYHTFMDKYMFEGMTNEDGSTNIFNSVLYYISMALQNNIPISQILEYLPYFEEQYNVTPTEEVVNALDVIAKSEEGSTAAGTSLLSLFSVKDLLYTLNYYSARSVDKYMEESGTIDNYAKYYEGCIKEINKIRPWNSRFILIGHYNPFGTKNYLKMLVMSLFNGEFSNHVDNSLDVFKKLLPSLEDFDPLHPDKFDFDKLMEEISALQTQFTELLKIQDFDAALTDMTVDMLFPFTVLLLNGALGGTYKEFNNIVEGLADKYHLTYVDVSDAPANGLMDPHPTKYGHEWIANRIYNSL